MIAGRVSPRVRVGSLTSFTLLTPPSPPPHVSRLLPGWALVIGPQVRPDAFPTVGRGRWPLHRIGRPEWRGGRSLLRRLLRWRWRLGLWHGRLLRGRDRWNRV